MNKEALIAALNGKLNLMAHSLDQNAPAISFWSGLALILGGSGLAVYKSLKKVPEIKNESLHKTTKAMNEYLVFADKEDLESEIARIKKEEKKAIAKEYIGPAIMVVGGTALNVGGFIGQTNRLKDVASKLALETAAFTAYRKRMADKIGEEQEKAIYYNADTEEITDENGETRTVMVDKGREQTTDIYTYEFSHDTTELCEPADDMYEYNMRTLRSREEEWTKILKADHVVHLNDILRALGLEDPENVTQKRIGWLDPERFDTPGEGYINFRITPMRYIASDGEMRWKFMLNFNCDGDIVTMLTKQRGVQGQIKKQWEVN